MKMLLENLRSADELVKKLLVLSENETVCLLDSCGVSHLGSHLLLAGLRPVETHQISHESAAETLAFIEKRLENKEHFAIFTLSYDFGLKLNNLDRQPKKFPTINEPDVFLALFDCLIIHDYNLRETYLRGDENRFSELKKLLESVDTEDFDATVPAMKTKVRSNFTKSRYLAAIEEIKERIRRGDTYQTNLTQQFTVKLPENLSPPKIFYRLRRDHPAPFASFIKRHETTVISASPERFFTVKSQTANRKSQIITVSPIKGTRPRGKNAADDQKLRLELLNSEKDRAENIMIVDLLRNDLGRVAKFGSVSVENLCDLEEHPTLFHLVSTVKAELRPQTSFSDLIRAVFPCGSITGAPKLRTMQIIDEIETADRGLSMGAIGFKNRELRTENLELRTENLELRTENLELRTENLELRTEVQKSAFEGENIKAQPQTEQNSTLSSQFSVLSSLDFSVAIRTMVIKNDIAQFNVGGGIVIDSIPEQEFEETLTKAKALLNAINAEVILPTD